MTWTNFVTRLEAAQAARQSDLVLLLNPRPFLLPHPVQRYDDPYLPFGKAVIGAVRERVSAIMFDLAAYLGMGAAGAVALERTIAFAAQDTLTILHAPFTGTGYAAAADSTGFGVDALTVTNPADMAFYLAQPPYAALWATDDERQEVPAAGGLYHPAARVLRLRGSAGEVLRLRVTGDEVLYASGRETFAEDLRRALEALL
ncbi:MAG: hypothetical protein MUE40_01780 [Anaerolineae bacterium]|jgi:hypothetical protein|nr:hypothetical protein [Anaerolineae bacterium]